MLSPILAGSLLAVTEFRFHVLGYSSLRQPGRWGGENARDAAALCELLKPATTTIISV
jgi:hypothetical protein